jgi:proline dehydrogenase
VTSSVFRSLVGWATSRPWLRRVATGTRLGSAVASRFVPGETLDSAMAAVRLLRADGICAVLGHLGENVTAPDQAAAAADAYIRSIERVREERDLDCWISVKLTDLGLDLSRTLCVSEFERVLEAAERSGTLVMIDMEGSAYVDRILDVFRDLSTRHERIGICLQASLRRTPSDLETLPAGCVVRLVKGAYLESPKIAFPKRRDVDAAFARCFVSLLARGHTVHAATHDPRLLQGATRIVERDGVPWSRVELQMLYGVRRDLQTRLARQGYPVRVYVPYGSDWYPYLARRLAERPANMWFFLSNLVRMR